MTILRRCGCDQIAYKTRKFSALSILLSIERAIARKDPPQAISLPITERFYQPLPLA
ncbi:hypothetical protein [Phormidium nigroviride]